MPEKRREAGFSPLDFEGVLTVLAPDALLAILKKGLAPGNAASRDVVVVQGASNEAQSISVVALNFEVDA